MNAAPVAGPTGNSGGSGNGRDEYFEQAGRFIIEKEKASIGMLQRMFKIGFNRAARIMDQLALSVWCGRGGRRDEAQENSGYDGRV